MLSPNMPTTVDWNVVGVVCAVSALTGLFFGVLPAYRSARLEPVEALRRE
jgi:putative ABC transport system permease protein